MEIKSYTVFQDRKWNKGVIAETNHNEVIITTHRKDKEGKDIIKTKVLRKNIFENLVKKRTLRVKIRRYIRNINFPFLFTMDIYCLCLICFTIFKSAAYSVSSLNLTLFLVFLLGGFANKLLTNKEVLQLSGATNMVMKEILKMEYIEDKFCSETLTRKSFKTPKFLTYFDHINIFSSVSYAVECVYSCIIMPYFFSGLYCFFTILLSTFIILPAISFVSLLYSDTANKILSIVFFPLYFFSSKPKELDYDIMLENLKFTIKNKSC